MGNSAFSLRSYPNLFIPFSFTLLHPINAFSPYLSSPPHYLSLLLSILLFVHSLTSFALCHYLFLSIFHKPLSLFPPFIPPLFPSLVQFSFILSFFTSLDLSPNFYLADTSVFSASLKIVLSH